MSSGAGETRVVSLEELVARAEELRDYAGTLLSAINSYLAQYAEIQTVIDTINSLPPEGASLLVMLNRIGSAMVPASLSKGWDSDILVNLGMNYYAKLGREKALEILSKRADSVKKVLDRLRRDYRAVAEEYSQIQQILAQVYAQLQSRAEGAQKQA